MGLRKVTRSRWLLLGAPILALLLIAAGPAQGQLTDTNGYITSANWLALGPFQEPFGCSGNDADILCNHIAPSYLHCQYPDEGDTIDYDPAQACTTAYTGPLDGGKPVWRLVDDAADNCLMDFDAFVDPAVDTDDVVMFAATYVEYLGADPIGVRACGNSDDGLQVWVDDVAVISVNSCRGAGDCAAGACDSTAEFMMEPGPHRILIGVWENGGGWAGSCRLQYAATGASIVDSDPDWVFHGAGNPGLTPPCGQLPRRTVVDAADPGACPTGLRGPLDVTITQQGGTATEMVTVTESITGSLGAADVTASNGGTVGEGRPGFIRQWLLLGPYTPILLGGGTGDNPGVDDMRLDYLSDGSSIFEADVAPKAGDDVDTAFDPVNGPSVALAVTDPVNPGGIPTWNAWNDADDTINFDEYYGGNVDTLVMYAVCYAKFAAPVANLYMGVGSDDGIQVLFDGDEVWANSIPRGWGNPEQIQDIIPLTDVLGGPVTAGVHRVMVKVFEGGGGHGFRLRFQDAVGNPVTAGITVSLDPSGTPTTAFPEAGGATIRWNVQRSVLQAGGVSYRANVHLGTFRFQGDVAGTATYGLLSTTLAAPPAILGPFDMAFDPEDNLDFGHEIGVACAGATIDQRDGPGTITISAGGADIWGTADQFEFAYSDVTGDFVAEVLITGRVMGNNEWGKHGIMVRENCSPGSRYFYVADQQADPALADCLDDAARDRLCYIENETAHQWRDVQGGDANWTGASPLPANTHADRLRLQRIGNEFTGYAMDAAGNWVVLGTHSWAGDPAPATLQLGLAVTSHDGCNLVTVTFEEWDVTIGTPAQPPRNAACAANAAGGVDVTWEVVGRNTGAQTITVNGTKVADLPEAATSHTVAAGDLAAGDVSAICVTNALGQACCGYFPGEALYINCGGLRLDDAAGTGIGDGRVWQEDTFANPTPFLSSTNANTADFAVGLAPPAQWTVAGNPDMLSLVEPEWTDDPARSRLFATERWADGPVSYRFAMPAGNYDVTLLFAEGCCSEGCQDIADPQSAGTPCRVIDASLNGDLVLDQFSQHVDAQKALGNALPNANWGVGLAKGPYPVDATADGIIEVVVSDLGGGDNPQNAAIKGIAIVKGGEGTRFKRGDANADGGMNITDGIYVLNYLFLGGETPTCLDAADSNGDNALNITDGIYILNYLFLGGPTPPAPGPDACGLDPDNDPDQNCVSYTTC